MFFFQTRFNRAAVDQKTFCRLLLSRWHAVTPGECKAPIVAYLPRTTQLWNTNSKCRPTRVIHNPVWSSTLDDLDGVKAMPMQYYIWVVAIVTVGTVRLVRLSLTVRNRKRIHWVRHCWTTVGDMLMLLRYTLNRFWVTSENIQSKVFSILAVTKHRHEVWLSCCFYSDFSWTN